MGSLTNELNPLDTNRSGKVTAADALAVINALANEELNNFAVPLRVVAALDGHQLDANGSGVITAGDALVVINYLAEQLASDAPVEAEQASWSDAVASTFAAVDDDEDDDWLAVLAADQDASRGKF